VLGQTGLRVLLTKKRPLHKLVQIASCRYWGNLYICRMEDLTTPQIGTTCPALTNENYEYRLSGDCKPFCICSLNDQPCTGRSIEDPEDRSSNFFSRGKCMISQRGLKRCPVFGASNETFAQIIKDKMQKELDEKLKHIGK